ncbi:hypothetical protein EXIGLDRAFT_40779 [Exidia glandulosa HHB12029]|uniref:Uncharacterized protein n=1 Tax=Exidia glandulosa HHB12029 TaxID=1314781 RepID=A0A166AN31_EXIGL|nr:hypothetical protein EXIGLDRAFT_40779 [Exidia glandulosa HHB12029]
MWVTARAGAGRARCGVGAATVDERRRTADIRRMKSSSRTGKAELSNPWPRRRSPSQNVYSRHRARRPCIETAQSGLFKPTRRYHIHSVPLNLARARQPIPCCETRARRLGVTTCRRCSMSV